MDVLVNLGSIPEIQDEVAALSRQVGQLAARIVKGERQQAEEIATTDVRIAEGQR